MRATTEGRREERPNKGKRTTQRQKEKTKNKKETRTQLRTTPPLKHVSVNHRKATTANQINCCLLGKSLSRNQYFRPSFSPKPSGKTPLLTTRTDCNSWRRIRRKEAEEEEEEEEEREEEEEEERRRRRVLQLLNLCRSEQKFSNF